MKGLNKFQSFNLSAFLEGKKLMCTGCRPWFNDSQKEIGKKVDLVIIEDKTVYPTNKDGSTVTNLYEKVTVKVSRSIDIPVEAIVTIVNGTATVFGEFRNQLSVRAEDVRVVTPPTTGPRKED
ncbi:hypothetical protein [Flavonifractor plautii]|uniref:hypothetical protein n=1 Tax=Flavonifractor plautii TaxID=292800 RepID=UPI0019573262|nr:hypothetical protein [Flavonifractor plautii]MBM6663503.1 hypothetical protein [Flavonifractor plautii]